MTVPDQLKYTKEHEWVRLEGEIATVGITHHAQDQLGDVVYVELPEVGTSVQGGEAFGTVESVKAVSDLYAPISGEVTEVNESLAESPEIVNQDPYGAGWMVKVKLSDAPTDLLSAHDYSELIASA